MNSRYTTSVWQWMSVCLISVVSLLLFGFVDTAMAQTITDSMLNPAFTCSNGSPSGQLYSMSGCAGGPQDGRVFSYFVCQFEEILNEVLSQTYCAIVFELTPAVMATLTLLVAITGIAFIMGITPFTAKELMVLAGKFCMVLTFATQAEYMIGVGYALFIAIAKEGIVIVLAYLFEGQNFSSGADVYRYFDQTLQNMMNLVTEGEEQDNQCENALFAMFIVIAAVVPPIAMLGIYFMFKVLWVMVRAVFGYCMGLLGVTFLVTLSPIYVSFALFKPTRSLFDKWVTYLISFSFQMVVVFAFLGMAFSILSRMGEDIEDYTKLVRPYKKEIQQGAGILNPIEVCGICELKPTQPGQPPECASDEAVEPTELIQNEEFMEFATVKVFSIMLIFYILDVMMDFVPQMARFLAGPKYAGQLGGGANSNMNIPGEQAIGSSLRAASGEMLRSSTTPSGIINGLVAGGRQAIAGQGGALDYMIRSVANPQQPMRNDFDTSPAGNLFGAAFGATAAAGVAQEYFGSATTGYDPNATDDPNTPIDERGAPAPQEPDDPSRTRDATGQVAEQIRGHLAGETEVVNTATPIALNIEDQIHQLNQRQNAEGERQTATGAEIAQTINTALAGQSQAVRNSVSKQVDLSALNNEQRTSALQALGQVGATDDAQQVERSGGGDLSSDVLAHQMDEAQRASSADVEQLERAISNAIQGLSNADSETDIISAVRSASSGYSAEVMRTAVSNLIASGQLTQEQADYLQLLS